jgi:cysteine-rich repeat protein
MLMLRTLVAAFAVLAALPPDGDATMSPGQTFRVSGASAIGELGSSIAQFGNSILVGAPKDVYPGTSIAVGSVYQFDLAGGAAPTATYQRPTLATVSGFGTSVAVIGSSLFVGDPNYKADTSHDNGSIHQFDLNTGNFVRTIPNPLPPGGDDAFASAMTVAFGRLIVGAPNYRAGTGRIYVFNATSGALISTCENPNVVTPHNDEFGAALAPYGEVQVLVGAPGYRMSNVREQRSGFVTRFNVSGAACVVILQTYGRGSGSRFGSALTQLGTMVAVGAPVERRVYLYDSSGTLVRTLFDLSAVSFGGSLGTLGDNLIVGVPGLVSVPGSTRLYYVGSTQNAPVETTTDSWPFSGRAVAAVGRKLIVGSPKNSPGGAVLTYDWSCGNGTINSGESCDDGNVENGDCCDSGCRPISNGLGCSDGNVCTTGDRCSNGACVGTCQSGTNCTNECGGQGICQVQSGACVCGDPPTFPTTSTSSSTSSSTSVHTTTSVSTTSTTIPAGNNAPVAIVRTPLTVLTNTVVVVDGTDSVDPDGDPITYSWTLITRPAGSTATLMGSTTAAPTFAPDKVGLFQVRLVVNDGHVNSAPATVDVNAVGSSPLSVAITYPPQGSIDLPSSTAVTGTVSGPTNTGVTVNGVPVGLSAGNWIAPQVPLKLGVNVLTATATNGTTTLSATKIVYSSGGSGGLSLIADPQSGVAPLTVTFSFKLASEFPVQSIAMDFDNDGVTDTTNPAALTTQYTTTGFKTAVLTATDTQGTVYEAFAVVEVIDLNTANSVFGAIWNGMNTALVNGNKATALTYLAEESKTKYDGAWTTLLPQMSTIVASYSAIQPIWLAPNFAQYGLTRVIGGQPRLFIVTFVRDENGVWHVSDM